MTAKAIASPAKPPFPHNESVMAKAVRTMDWSGSPLGPIDSWSQCLRTAAGIVLASPGVKVLVWGPELITIYNDGYIPLLGGLPGEGLGKSYPDLRPDMWPMIGPYLEAAMRGAGEMVTQLRTLLRRSGTEEDVYFALCFTPVYDADGTIAGVIQDVVETTLYLRAQASLETENRRFQALFDQAPIFLTLLATPDLRFEYVNLAYEKLIGRGGLVGQTVAEAMPELASQGFLEALVRVYETGEPLIARNAPCSIFRVPGGPLELLYLNFIYQPIVDGDGTITGILCAGSDVTDEHVATDRAEALQSKITHGSRMSAMGTMAATMAHELNQPLTAAGNYLAGCRRRVGALRDPEKSAIGSALELVHEQIRRAGEIIRHARTMAQSTGMTRESVPLDALVARSLSYVKASLDCKNITMRTVPPPVPITLLADPIQTEQVLVNLIRNSCQAMKGCPRRELVISSRNLGDGFAEILICDTGRGLPPQTGDSLFTAFTASASGGLGLGLSLSRTLVEAHGGTMRAENNPEAGASFHFTLPVARAMEKAPGSGPKSRAGLLEAII